MARMATTRNTTIRLRRFRATCWRCERAGSRTTTIVSYNGGSTWSHVTAPAERHVAHPTGVMVEF